MKPEAARTADVNILLQQGFAAVDAKDPATAEQAFTQAAKLQPRSPWPQLGLAVLRLDLRDMDGALKAAAQARQLECPPDVLCKLGVFYKEAGEPDQAAACLRDALAKDPGNAMAWYNLRDLKKFKSGDADIDALNALAAKSAALTPHAQAQLQFTLGKAYLDAGDADRAFARYAEGNALKRAGQKYDIAVFEKYIDGIIHSFNEDTVNRLRSKTTVKTQLPVFIIGMPRSGSTLVDQILSSHPAAASIGESRLLQNAIGANAVSQDFVAQLTPQALDAMAQRYLTSTEPYAKGATRVVDKMLFNFVWAGVILTAFPEAKVIHCARGGADLGLSVWRTLFAGNVPWAFDQRETGRYYLASERLMKHWRNLFPEAVLGVTYEVMVADHENETRRLLKFCGLPYDARCLEFHKTRRRVSTASDMQVRRPVYGDAVGGGRKYAKYLQPLLETLEGKR